MWKRTRELKGTRENLIYKSKYPFFVMLFDFVSFALDLKKEQYGLRWRLHSTLLRYESKTKYRNVLNKLFEEALDYAFAHKDEFPDHMDRQLIDFLKSYMYHKKTQQQET